MFPRVNSTRSRSLIQLAALILLLVSVPLFFVPGPHLSAQSGITSPAPGSVIAGDVPIIGAAIIEPFQKYELHYKIEPSGDDGFVYFDGSTSPVANGQLGVWRAAGLPPGLYTLRLRVVKADGNYAEFFAPNLSVNQGAAPTATPSTPTETPTSGVPTPTYTPAPSATPNVGAVVQPQLETPAAPTPGTGQSLPATPLPGDAAAQPVAAIVATSLPGDLGPAQPSSVGAIVEPDTSANSTRQLGEALSINRLREQFYRGVRISAAIFLVALALYGGKFVFGWARRHYG
jgi:hypothetical protein